MAQAERPVLVSDKSIHAVIEGHVQGVGYRAWCSERARKRALSGWVRNRASGSVEAVFSGEAENVEGMLAELWSGPTAARVERVTARETRTPEPGFQTLPTV